MEQFSILAKSQKGQACCAIIQQVLSHPKIFQFEELLQISNVEQLSSIPDCRSAYDTLELFAYGTYHDYRENINKYLTLNENQIKKLKQLSILSLLQSSKTIAYKEIMLATDIEEIRVLENIIIDMIYLNVLEGKFDQRSQVLRVTTCMIRDVPKDHIDTLIQQLILWKENCTNIIQNIDSSSSLILQNEREKYTQESYQLHQIVKDINNKLTSKPKSSVTDIDNIEGYHSGYEDQEDSREDDVTHIRHRMDPSSTSSTAADRKRSAKRMKGVTTSSSSSRS